MFVNQILHGNWVGQYFSDEVCEIQTLAKKIVLCEHNRSHVRESEGIKRKAFWLTTDLARYLQEIPEHMGGT